MSFPIFVFYMFVTLHVTFVQIANRHQPSEENTIISTHIRKSLLNVPKKKQSVHVTPNLLVIVYAKLQFGQIKYVRIISTYTLNYLAGMYPTIFL